MTPASPEKTQIHALFRITILVSVVTLLFGVWEYRHGRNLQPIDGQVIKVENVLGSRGGDNRRFIIEYHIGDERFVTAATRGIVDYYGAFCCLAVGDTVSIAMDRDDPSRAILDSFSARYPLTLSFTVLLLVVLAILAIVVRRLPAR